jgi:hypothetical protein
MFSALLMTATMATPTMMPPPASAAESGAAAAVVIRVYDPFHHDYHRWDRREERAYREYLAERHRRYIAYRRQRLAERRAYWRWRHEREERLEHERR